jgi:methionyl-tRNA formyltransferase
VSKVRVCFLGTPEFAVTALKGLLADEHFEVVGVVTQPDRPAGRKLLLTPSPVKSFALSQGLEVLSPEKINQELILQQIEKWDAEVAVVVAFGQILSTKFLNLFPFGAVNIHGSLLPAWRGAAPIQRSIEAGEQETGVTLQKIVKELDAGDVLGTRKITVPLEMTAMELHDKMAQLGVELLHVELMDYVRGNLAPIPQDHSQVTYAKKIEKSECLIDWTWPALKIHHKVRAFTMGPGVYTVAQAKKLKIHRSFPLSGRLSPGEVSVKEQKLIVGTGDGLLEILEAQPESKARMSGADALRSLGLTEGDRLG